MPFAELPIDIQNRIFTEIYWEERVLTGDASQKQYEAICDGEPVPAFREADTMWGDDLKAVPNLFPHTTASVCQQWRSILSTTSRFWSRFILDLDDPACLPLDVFSWSQSRLLDVKIQSHPQETSDGAKERENASVLAAFKALTPYISSCTTIIFDVKYASSLPSPAAFLINENAVLGTLSLEYQIDDLATPVSLDISAAVTLSKKLCDFTHLSLHAATFMEISRAHPGWLEKIPSPSYYTSLTLSHLECCVKDESYYSIAELIEHLSVPKTISPLTFKHARFLGQPEIGGDTPDNLVFDPEGRFQLGFEDADSNFISDFMHHATSGGLWANTFKSCQIPRLPWSCANKLYLNDISDSQSLKNILENHNGQHIYLTSCPYFDDGLLDWLAADLHIPELRKLTIHQCDQFTVAGIRAFMQARKAGTPEVPDPDEDSSFDPDQEVGAITYLDIRSTGLRLTEEDEEWFKEYIRGGGGYMSWEEDGYSFKFSQSRVYEESSEDENSPEDEDSPSELSPTS